MPSYLSHTIMANNVYQRINGKTTDKNYMITYSLGGDLCKYAKCRYASHHQDMDKFIYHMADYIKQNGLTNDAAALSLLYAHICHYMMDNTIHPLVRAVDKACQNNKKNHRMIELYYDFYLTKQILNKRIDEYASSNILSVRNNKTLNRIIDYAYNKTYNAKHIARYYKFNLSLYRKIKYLYILFGYNFLKKISHINKFINRNKDIDLLNNNHLIIYKDYQGKPTNDDLITTYHKAVERSIKYIKGINKYLNI